MQHRDCHAASASFLNRSSIFGQPPSTALRIDSPPSACYMEYYNTMRTHLSLGKDAPIWRDIQCAGRIEVRPVLGGLHHQYVRI